MNALLFPALMALSAITVALALILATRITAKNTPLGVSVPESKIDHPIVQASIRRYQVIVGIASAITAVACLILAENPLLTTVGSLIVVAASMYAYLSQRKEIIRVKEQEGWYRYDNPPASATVRQEDTAHRYAHVFDKLPTPRFPAELIFSSLLIIAVSMLAVAHIWDSIPEVFPTHWGPSLEPDAWSEKSFFSVYGISLVNLGLVALMALSTWFSCMQPQKVRSDRSIAGQLRTRASLAATAKGLELLMMIMAATLSFVQIVMVQPQYEHLMGLAFALVVGGSLLGTIIILIPILTAQTKADDIIRAEGIPTDTPSSDSDEFYKWGMFYMNPDDPAIMVEKRHGTGMDFNYAHWQGKVFMAFIALLLIGSIGFTIYALTSG